MITKENVIGRLVADDYRTAEVFAKYGIDFCCKGNLKIGDVCEKKNIAAHSLLADLNNAVAVPTGDAPDFKSWPLDLLADYIEKKHHRYITGKTPQLIQYLDKVSRVHGDLHPELILIDQLFESSSQELAAHMKKEELILFPFIRKMVATGQVPDSRFGTVENPISMMKHEHDVEGERFRRIAQLSNNYNAPAEACNTYRVAYAMLKEFEQDLHHHIHLENNILFPKAIEMEASLSNTSCAI